MPSLLWLRDCPVLFILSARLGERCHCDSHFTEEKTEGCGQKNYTKSLRAQRQNAKQATQPGSESLVSSPASVCAEGTSSLRIQTHQRIPAERDLGIICHLALQTATLRPEEEASRTAARQCRREDAHSVSNSQPGSSFLTPPCLA